MIRIESLLSARLFAAPQLVGNRLYFLSNMSGRMSLYAMDHGGSIPEPLLPPNIALQNPDLMQGPPFKVFPELGLILIMIDHDGDEQYQPMVIPIDGGFPLSAFEGLFLDVALHIAQVECEQNHVIFLGESQKASLFSVYLADLDTREVRKIREATYGCFPLDVDEQKNRLLLLEVFGPGDHVLHMVDTETLDDSILYGTPLDQRGAVETVKPNNISSCCFSPSGKGILVRSSLFSDTYDAGFLSLESTGIVEAIAVDGLKHKGMGEFAGLERLAGNHYFLEYNIDGCSWGYVCSFDEQDRRLSVLTTLCGEGDLSDCVLKSIQYDRSADRICCAITSAMTPSQIYTMEGTHYHSVIRHTRERVLGIESGSFSPGEDASFTSHDGLRISARLYLPSSALGFQGPFPVVHYVHGGPQSQERPDFSWFSMPLIQFLTLRGMAVFVPNARGSTGYGFDYMRYVVKDWGGLDRLDHVFAMSEVLPRDSRLDTSRAGVVGRSYGGFMTLTLAARHPELWSGAVDMFGPYDLLSFIERNPETWKPYIQFLLGDSIEDRDFLIERSPRTWIHNMTCPLLVIQGRNDPRVAEQESRELVEELKTQGKKVSYLMFNNEGHDVLKYANRVRCYNAIGEFFESCLKPL